MCLLMLLPIARPKSTGTAFPMCRAVCLIVTSLFGAIEQRFKTADAIAMKLGIEKTAMVRVRAAIAAGIVSARPTD